jgi:predicted transcriptional regulator
MVHRTVITLDEDVDKSLREMASSLNRKISNVVHAIIKDYLKTEVVGILDAIESKPKKKKRRKKKKAQ